MPWWMVSLRALRCGFSLQADQLNLWTSALTHFVTPRYVGGVRPDATADPSVRGVFSPDEFGGKRFNWPQHRQRTLTLARGSPSLNVDKTPRRRCSVQQRTQSGGDKQRRSRRTRSEENLMRRPGESTLNRVPQGCGRGTCSLAPRRPGSDTSTVTTSKPGRHPRQAPVATARCPWSSKWLAGDGVAWLISTTDNVGVLPVPLGIWMRRLLSWTFADTPRVSTVM